MTNCVNQIGIAPFCHSDFPMEKRFCQETNLFIVVEPAQWADDICLFRLPEHLRKRWWNLAAKELAKSDESPNFNSFLDAFKVFADFKGIPISREHQLEIIIRPPGEPLSESLRAININALVNLGDEQTYVLIDTQQVLLQSGDGCSIPLGCTLKPADTIIKTDVDVLLQIWHR